MFDAPEMRRKASRWRSRAETASSPRSAESCQALATEYERMAAALDVRDRGLTRWVPSTNRHSAPTGRYDG